MSRTALITGGAKGIGLAIAEEFAKDHDVAIVWNTAPPKDISADIHLIRADLTQAGSCNAVIDDVMAHFGKLDVIVNNAGLVRTTPIDSFDADAHRAILDVNLLVPSDLLAAALAHLKSGAAIVNISSVNATMPPKTAAIYGASKAALNLWTKAMAKELGPLGIRVNAVAPGAIAVAHNPRSAELTELFVKETALGRPGQPDDIAPVVRFLSSDAARFITGEILTVSGGYRL